MVCGIITLNKYFIPNRGLFIEFSFAFPPQFTQPMIDFLIISRSFPLFHFIQHLQQLFLLILLLRFDLTLSSLLNLLMLLIQFVNPQRQPILEDNLNKQFHSHQWNSNAVLIFLDVFVLFLGDVLFECWKNKLWLLFNLYLI